MGTDSKIEWTHHTFNPWRGCTKVSEGCKNCYADTLSHRNPKVLGVWGPNGTRVVAAESYWREPLKWNAAAKAAGERHRVFCASLADVFEGPETMPTAALSAVRDARVRLFDLILQTPSLDWLLLTKRPQNWRNIIEESLILSQGGDPDDKNYFADHDGDFEHNTLSIWLNVWLGGDVPKNVWLGRSVENQATADEGITHLLQCPAAVRFLSVEPLLGPVDITDHLWGRSVLCKSCPRDADCACGFDTRKANQEPAIDWVIVGGESGSNARPMHPDWVRSIRDQCVGAGVPFFFKQWGMWTPGENVDRQKGTCKTATYDGEWSFERENMANAEGHRDDQPDLYLVGKKEAGRTLDGRTWDEMPKRGAEVTFG